MNYYRKLTAAGATIGVATLLMAGILLAGCRNDDVVTLDLSTDALAFQSAGGTQTFTVSSGANAWNVAVSDGDWLSVTPADGSKDGTVTVAAASHTGYVPREGSITVSAADVTPKTVAITQAEAPLTPLDHTSWRELFINAMNANPTIAYGDGVRYKGQTADGTPNGLGMYCWAEEDFYFGARKDGARIGYGIYIVDDFVKYEVSNCSKCKIYAGNWLNGGKDGTGACYDVNGVRIYYGEFKDDKPVGTYPSEAPDYNFTFHISRTNEGDYFLTEHYQGKRSGNGMILYQNRDMWFGPWKDGIRDGYGMMLRSDGTVSAGTWKGDAYTP